MSEMVILFEGNTLLRGITYRHYGPVDYAVMILIIASAQYNNCDIQFDKQETIVWHKNASIMLNAFSYRTISVSKKKQTADSSDRVY